MKWEPHAGQAINPLIVRDRVICIPKVHLKMDLVRLSGQTARMVDKLHSALLMFCVAGFVGSAQGCGGGGSKDPVLEENHPRIYLPRNKTRLVAAVTAGRPEATRFIKMVDGWMGGNDVYAFQAWFAALASQLTGDAKYCTAAIKNVDANVIAEEKLIAEGNRPELARDSYLYVGEVVGDIMLTYDWCFDQVTASQKTRWLKLADQAVWNVWHHETATWGGKVFGWSGWSIDNPSNNYYYSFLRATMLLGLGAHGEIASGDEWIMMFRDTKIGGELIPQFGRDLVGGGSREGTGYGVSMKALFELYDFWEGSTGEDISIKTDHARQSLRTTIHQIVPTLDRLAPTGDHARDSTASLYDYHRHYLLELMARYQADPAAGPTKTLLAASSVPEMISPFNYVHELLNTAPDLVATPLSTLGRSHYASGIGQIYTRTSWDKDATWLNFSAGAYTESHAHQDQGNFLIYKDGWLAYDPIIDSHSGIPQDAKYHNIVRVVADGEDVKQPYGTVSKLQALHRGDGWIHFAADLTPAYQGAASVTKMERELVFIEPNALVVFDRVVTAAGTQQVWQLNVPEEPTLNGASATMTAAGHTLTTQRLLPANAVSSVYAHSTDSDFTKGSRLDATVPGGNNQFMHVLWIDGDVGSATLSDAANQRGVALTFADGGTATVRFGAAGLGGSLQLTRTGASTTAALTAGVDTLPQ